MKYKEETVTFRTSRRAKQLLIRMAKEKRTTKSNIMHEALKKVVGLKNGD